MKKFLALILFMGCTFFVGRQCKQAIVCLFLFCFEITGASHPKQCFIESLNLFMKNVRLHQNSDRPQKSSAKIHQNRNV